MGRNQKSSIGFWASLIRYFRLAWRLLWDPRVPVWTKLVPCFTLFYIAFPIDLFPDLFLGLGQLDDLGILLLGVRLFSELVPREIVLQHLQEMGYAVDRWRVVEEEPPYIEGEYEVKEDNAGDSPSG